MHSDSFVCSILPVGQLITHPEPFVFGIVPVTQTQSVFSAFGSVFGSVHGLHVSRVSTDTEFVSH